MKAAFYPPTTFSTDSGPVFVTIGHFNGDAFDDIAVSNAFSNSFSILLGDGNGGFSAPINNYSLTIPGAVIAVGHFNTDAFDDLAITELNTNEVSILLGDGNGGFSAPTNFAVGNIPRAIAVEDFNGDNFEDLVVTNGFDDSISILLGVGDGTFASAINYSVGNYPYSVITGNFNGDAFDDIAVANFDSNNISILLGVGDGTFASAINYNVGNYPVSMALGRFNNDSVDDIAVANADDINNNISILLGDGVGGFSSSTFFPTGGVSPNGIGVGNFNNDAFQDLAVVNESSETISILAGDGNGNFSIDDNFPVGVGGEDPFPLAVGKFNGDSLDDIVVGNFNNNNVSVFLQQGDITPPTLAEVTQVTTPTNDNTPNYTFSSTEAGTITYGGDCSSTTTSASSGNNTITFNTLADGIHSNCTITLTDASSNASTPLAVSSFIIDTTPPTNNNGGKLGGGGSYYPPQTTSTNNSTSSDNSENNNSTTPKEEKNNTETAKEKCKVSFLDVPTKFCEKVKFVYDKGIMQGLGNNPQQFGSYLATQRDEALKVALLAFKHELKSKAECKDFAVFPDLKSEDWGFIYICTGYKGVKIGNSIKQVIGGYEGGEEKGKVIADKKITKFEALALLMRASNASAKGDPKSSHWAYQKGVAAYAKEHNLFQGGIKTGDQTLTRLELAELIQKVLALSEEK